MLPEELITLFRAIATDRIERIESAWALVLTSLAEEPSSTLQREIHTLKGEASVAGFTDVATLCHRLEDLVEVARARGYAVDEDFDLAVNMVLQFIVMLVRRRADEPSSMDLPGFLRHIDRVQKTHEHTGRSRAGSVPPQLRAIGPGKLSAEHREHLGTAAVDAFLEYAVAQGPRRDRLRKSWHLLRDLIGIQRAVVSSAQLAKYKPNVLAIAKDLGKEVELSYELGTAEVTAEILAAIDTAILHLVRNAIDHGIETPAVREASGKPRAGSIRIHGGIRDHQLVIAVEDDGAGIAFDRVHARAVELGLLPAEGSFDDERLVDVMCHPGFSTRTEASAVSGRGVGLDAVRGTTVDLGGWITARSETGRGTTWTITIPVPVLAIRNYAIRAPGLRFPVVLSSSWRPLENAPEMPIVIDLAAALGLAPTNSISSTVWWFTNGQLEIGFLAGGKPSPLDARRLVATVATTVAEVVTVDSVEGLLLRPEHIPGITS